MKHAEHGSHHSDALKRKIPDRMPGKESLSAGFALPAFAHSLNGLSLKERFTYSQPVTLSERSQKKVAKAPPSHTSDTIRIEHLQVWGDTVLYDAFPADWRIWDVLAPKKLLTPVERRLAHLAGVSIAWLTTEPDGSHKLAVQKRDMRNRTNPATYGPSASGAWDAELTVKQGLKFPADASPANAQKNAFRETEEELGIPMSILTDPRTTFIVSGIVNDKIKPHYDITYFGTLPLSAAEVRTIHAGARNNDSGKDHDHTDGLTFIDATPRNIQILLTEVHSPLPPVSVATFLLAGYMIVMQETLAKTNNQEEALNAALAWKKVTEQGIEGNYKHMFRRSRAINRVRSNEALIEAIKKGVLRKGFVDDAKNAIGQRKKYDTKLPPHKQGLEGIDFSLRDAGIETD